MSDSNEKHQKFTWLWFSMMTLIYFITSIALLSPSVLKELLAKEVQLYVDAFGPEVTQSVVDDAISKKQWLLYDSGAYAAVQSAFLPKQYRETGSVTDKKIFNTVFFKKVDSFINNAFQSFDLAILRYCSLIPWMIFGVLIIGLCSYTGYLKREIKKQGFDYSSPFRRGLSKKFIVFLPVLITVILMIPVPLSPYVFPFLLFLTGINIMIFVSNTIKRL